ncbi:MAG: zinc finger domain-containing protein [Candidatus Methanofastidiosia archaeon]
MLHRRKGGKCPVCGTDLERIHVSGRSAYFCPEHQSK